LPEEGGWYKLATRFHQMKTAELVLALSATLLQICLLIFMVRRRSFKVFPSFAVYVAFSVTSTLAGLVASNNESAYMRAYWTSEVLYVLLAFLALLEVFKSVFRSFYRLPWFRLLFPAIGVLMVCTAVVRSIASPPTEVHRAFAVVIFLELAVRFLQIGLLFLFFALVRFFHLFWRQQALGIALGFGISAAGSLVVFLLRSEFGTKLDYVVRIAPPIAYTLAVVVWLLTFISPQPNQPLQGPPPALTPEEMLAEVRQYSSTVKKILKR
jgi:hypothetical protein